MASFYCHMESLFDVYPESFNPRPKVISSVVRLVPHQEKPVPIAPDVLGRVVVAAFSQRRKTLRNSLSALFSVGEMESLGIDPGERAERLSLADFARLAELLLQRENRYAAGTPS
jgi:16S rRNA (adenine1518-N6/adenine1519-N6)-dimethyltransferase